MSAEETAEWWSGLSAAITFGGLVLVALAALLVFWLRTRHRHDWRGVSVQHGRTFVWDGAEKRTTNEITVALWRCRCSAVKTTRLTGQWDEAELFGAHSERAS